jgi:hypothetical protein
MWLFPNWQNLLLRAWSVRLTLLSAMFAAGEVALPLAVAHELVEPGWRGWCSIAAGVCAGGSIIARLIPQKGLSVADD